MDVIKPTDLTVNIEDVKKLKKAEIIKLFEEKQDLWIKYLNQVGQEHQTELDAVGKSLLSHPDYQALKKRHDHLIVERDEAVRQRDRAKAKAESLKQETGLWKKAGRKPLDPAVADRIMELRATGLSIRKIVEQLEAEGMKASKGYVWNVLNDRNDHKKIERVELKIHGKQKVVKQVELRSKKEDQEK